MVNSLREVETARPGRPRRPAASQCEPAEREPISRLMEQHPLLTPTGRPTGNVGEVAVTPGHPSGQWMLAMASEQAADIVVC